MKDKACRSEKPMPIYVRLLKIVLWTAMGVALFLYAVLTCLVSVLSPDKLTPLVERVANSFLDADVKIAKVELYAKSTYPFLRLEVDSVSVVSKEMSMLKLEGKNALPEYSDTLLTVENFVGELHLPALFRGEINVKNVSVVSPEINIVILNDSINNFNIFPQAEAGADDDGIAAFPKIVLSHFAFDAPKPFRYLNVMTGDYADLKLKAVLTKDGDNPEYRLEFDGNMRSPMLGAVNLSELPFYLNGEIRWDCAEPYKVSFDKFACGAAFLSAEFNLGIDFTKSLVVENFDMSLAPVKVSDLISLVPDTMSFAGMLRTVDTDAEVGVRAVLDRRFDVDKDTVPYATLTVEIPDARLRFGKARFENFSTCVNITTRGNDLNAATLKLDRLNIAGPATYLSMAGSVGEIFSDPVFEGRVNGYTDLAKLPDQLLTLLGGSVAGKIVAAVGVKGRQSMLDRNNFHKLYVEGDINGRNLYWLSADTANMVYVKNSALHFGTKEHLGDSEDDLFAVTFSSDTAKVLSGDVTVNTTGLAFGLGALNTKMTDTLAVMPMGGGLKASTVNVSSVADSAGVRLRDISGRVVMRRFNNMARVPEFVFDLGINRMAAGSPDARVLFSGSELHFTAHKIPAKKTSKELVKIADSISAVYPELPMDSVYRLAMEKHRRKRGQTRRVHVEPTDTASEIIDWGTSKGLSRLLLEWSLEGSLKSKRAGLYTPHFPLRNRLDNLNIKFNNDSVVFTDIAYKVGHSDFLAGGVVSNIKRALTSKRGRQSVKLEFEAVCDTVDVNELADAFFKGAAYSSSTSSHGFDIGLTDDEDMYYDELTRRSDELSDSVAPLLIPVNIEADIKLNAYNILYADLLLHDLTGSVLVYDGALNLHKLQASSDAGSIDLSALYSAPEVNDMRFGFGMKVSRFDIDRFMTMVPALDSIMPLLHDISGIIDADIAATVNIDKNMDLDLSTLNAAIKLEGDSLQLLDAETFKTIAKWLMFKNKQKNIIDHMNVEMLISDNQMQLFPFIFDIDRYKLGVQGYNDLALNFNYLISVLKSPLPFKFGITLKGNPDDYKIRLGGAKFDEKQAVERKFIVDTARINLVDQIENVFRRGVRKSKFAKLDISENISGAADINLREDSLTAADSLVFIREGLIPAPESEELQTDKSKSKK